MISLMNPITHALVGWTVARPLTANRREQAMIALAGILPDLDGLGLPFEALSGGHLDWYSTWHHTLTHNLTAALALSAALAGFSHWRCGSTANSGEVPAVPESSPGRLFLACLFSTHLHLLGDLVGSRGPDGDPWPIPYLFPFSPQSWVAPIQWEINAWPNLVLTVVLLWWAFRRAWQEGFSPLGYFSPHADQIFISTLRQRFGDPVRAAQTPSSS